MGLAVLSLLPCSDSNVQRASCFLPKVSFSTRTFSVVPRLHVSVCFFSLVLTYKARYDFFFPHCVLLGPVPSLSFSERCNTVLNLPVRTSGMLL